MKTNIPPKPIMLDTAKGEKVNCVDHEELVSELETIKRLLDRNNPQINPASQRLSTLIRDLAKGEARYGMV